MILPFRIPAAAPFHSRSGAGCILFFAVEVARIIIASTGIRVEYLVAGLRVFPFFFDTAVLYRWSTPGQGPGAPTTTLARVPPPLGIGQLWPRLLWGWPWRLPGHRRALPAGGGFDRTDPGYLKPRRD